MLVVASLCIEAGDAHAQSIFFLRPAPEVGQITAAHTKRATTEWTK